MSQIIPRRKFIRSAALAGGSMVLLPHLKGNAMVLASPANGYFLNEFGIDEALCRKLLSKALSRGGDFADLYFEHTVSSFLGLEDGKVNRSYGDITLGVGIRTVKGDQVGYGFTQDLTEESMMSVAATAASLCDTSATAVSDEFSRPALKNYYPVDPGLIEIPGSLKLPVLQQINEKCFSFSPLVVKVNAGFSHDLKHIMVVTSDGIIAEDTQPSGYIYASVVVEKDGKRESSGWNLGGKRDFSYYTSEVVEKVASKAVNNALKLFDAIQPPAGEIPVVLGPGVTGILLHEAIGHGMEADFNRKKISTYSTMLNKKVAEPFVTIIDDATNLNLSGSINVDDEGVPGKKTILVENGILTGYLHDKISAKHYGVEPTGNGRRQSFEHYPLPRMRNTYMLGGDAMPEDVVKAAGNGIYVEDVSNGQVKIGEGDFAFYVSQGRMIENGKLTAPVKDINIMGNGPKMLSNIVMAANDLEMFEGGGGMCGKNGQGVRVSFGLPTCLVKSMTVGGTRQKGGAS
ncbi:MAG: TldD/PmbA family protein [Bacteroidales bacterium]|nr:TldD/PmbA family protein [Bacteroidales bacterium]MBN2762571.1 TldD/PmbA family protein [Bacteroidales bacterium]